MVVSRRASDTVKNFTTVQKGKGEDKGQTVKAVKRVAQNGEKIKEGLEHLTA